MAIAFGPDPSPFEPIVETRNEENAYNFIMENVDFNNFTFEYNSKCTFANRILQIKRIRSNVQVNSFYPRSISEMKLDTIYIICLDRK